MIANTLTTQARRIVLTSLHEMIVPSHEISQGLAMADLTHEASMLIRAIVGLRPVVIATPGYESEPQADTHKVTTMSPEANEATTSTPPKALAAAGTQSKSATFETART